MPGSRPGSCPLGLRTYCQEGTQSDFHRSLSNHQQFSRMSPLELFRRCKSLIVE